MSDTWVIKLRVREKDGTIRDKFWSGPQVGNGRVATVSLRHAKQFSSRKVARLQADQAGVVSGNVLSKRAVKRTEIQLRPSASPSAPAVDERARDELAMDILSSFRSIPKNYQAAKAAVQLAEELLKVGYRKK